MGRVVSLELRRSTSVTGGWFLTKSRGMLVVCVPGALGVHGTSLRWNFGQREQVFYRLVRLALKNLVY